MSQPTRFRPGRATLFALGVTLIALAWTRTLVSRAERDFPPQGKFITVEGHRVHYIEKGAGMPIVLLHGAYGGLGDWTATIFDEVAARGRAIALDRPGHGYSERSDDDLLTPAAQARFVHAFLRELGIERAVLVGFSWSGGLALSHALQFEESTAGVMTLNGALYEWENISSLSDAALGLPVVGPLFAATFAMPAGQLVVERGVGKAFYPAMVDARFARSPVALELRPLSLLATAAELRTLKPALRLQSPHYREIKVPVTIVTGLGDKITYARFHSYRLNEEVRGSRLVPVEGAGHQLLYSHSGAVISALDLLLADVQARERERSEH
ncbi:MAG: alpha/beta hydrolase [Planctomycetes bacterium]|nr:alpha/beta hydrolase [Planctomycetota bacterium]